MEDTCIGIVDYDAGNIQSVMNALDYIGVDNQLVSDPGQLANFDGLIIPGVGAFDDAMDSLTKKGLVDGLNAIKGTKPVLGICLGMQVLCLSSDEGNKAGLGWVNAKVRKMEANNYNIKIPHMGWNQVNHTFDPLFDGIPNSSDFYFVHSFCVVTEDNELIKCDSEHGGTFTSAFAKDDIYGVQFHPEKSQDHGLTLLSNFVKVCHGKK